jgi:hypothetical protein
MKNRERKLKEAEKRTLLCPRTHWKLSFETYPPREKA